MAGCLLLCEEAESPFANLIEASRTVGCRTNRRHCEERINKQLATVSGLLLALPRVLTSSESAQVKKSTKKN